MLLIENIASLATMNHTGSDLAEITDAALLIDGERIEWCGSHRDLPMASIKQRIDAHGSLVLPGLIDCHSHLIFAGSRADEFARRMNNETYLAIMQKGGGIMSTVNKTREACDEELLACARDRATRILRAGVTTLEAKSGYGLSTEQELRILRLTRALHNEHEIDLHPSFLGAHVIPVEYKDNRENYIQSILCEMLPEVASQKLADDCDVFCEQGAFSFEEALAILAHAHDLGLGLRAHVQQLSYSSGGVSLVKELPIKSLSHADFVSDEDIDLLASSDTVIETLPFASLFLRSPHHTPVRALANRGVALAIASDFNPGSAMCHDLILAARLGVVHYGFSIPDALRAITVVAARSLGRDDIGVIKKGAIADIILTNVASVNEFFYDWTMSPIRSVIKRGRIVCN